LLKKIGIILLALALLVSLVACTPEPEPEPEEVAFDAYTHIMQQLSIGPGQDAESGAYDIDFVMQMDMWFLGEEIQTTSSGNIKMIVDGDRIESAMTMNTDMGELGTNVMEIYMALEGTTLIEMQVVIDGEEVSEEHFPSEMFDEMLDSAVNMPDFEKEAFQTVEIEEVNGNTVMHMVLDGQMLSDFVIEAMGSALGELDALGMGLTFEIDDIPMTITTDAADNPLSMTMEMLMRMEIEMEDAMLPEGMEQENMEMIVSATIEYTFNAFGESVEVEMFV